MVNIAHFHTMVISNEVDHFLFLRFCRLLGYIDRRIRQYEKAIEFGKRSVELHPNNSFFRVLLGSTLNDAGHIDAGIKYIKHAIRLNPFPAYYYYYHLGRCYLQKVQYEKALAEFKKALQRAPESAGMHGALAVTYALLGREEEARSSAARSLELEPCSTVGTISKLTAVKDQAFSARLADALRKAGFSANDLDVHSLDIRFLSQNHNILGAGIGGIYGSPYFRAHAGRSIAETR